MNSKNITPIQFLSMYQNNPKKETANERKATEIAENNLKWYYEEGNSYDECYQSALQAMEWKDKQRKQEKQKWIEEACEQLENYFAPDGSMVPENIRLWQDLKQIIKEL